MALKLSLIALVYPNASGDPGLSVTLLQKANAWLQRGNANISDGLLLIGVGFADESAFQAMLKPYGLAGADIDVTPPGENFDENIAEDLGEAVESIAASWISKHHGNAIPIVKWSDLVPDAAYPDDGWWWVGLEANDDEQSSLADILKELLPDAFKKQALTWATIIAEAEGLSGDGEHEVHEAAMQVVALARWLTGFDAATENNFYDFSASDAIDAADLDALRLGFEAGRNHESELSDYFDGNDETDEGLAGACLLACLDERMGAVRTALSNAFGGDSLLFWSLYRSIWPDLKRSSDDNMEGLVGLRDVDMGDIDRPWRFVTDGWIDFAEE